MYRNLRKTVLILLLAMNFVQANAANPVKTKKNRKPGSVEDESGFSVSKNSNDLSKRRIRERALNLSLIGGYGFSPGVAIGVGGKLTYTLRKGLFFGGSGIYHLGTSASATTTTAAGPTTFTAAVKIITSGVDLGYRFRLNQKISISPQLHGGIATVFSSLTSNKGYNVSSTKNLLSLAPTLGLAYEATAWSIGVDTRYYFINGGQMLASFGLVGFKF